MRVGFVISGCGFLAPGVIGYLTLCFYITGWYTICSGGWLSRSVVGYILVWLVISRCGRLYTCEAADVEVRVDIGGCRCISTGGF